MTDIDADLEQVRVPTEVRVAGGLHTFSGLMAFLTGLQLMLTVRFRADFANLVPYVLIATGLIALVLGTSVYRGKGNAALAATVIAGLHFVGGAAWFVLLLSWGVGSLIAAFVPLFGLAAVALGAYVLPKVMKIDAARRRLAESGLSMGM